MKGFMSLFRNFLFSFFIIYIFNLMAVGLGLFIPVNLVSVLLVTFLRFPGLIMLIYLLFVF